MYPFRIIKKTVENIQALSMVGEINQVKRSLGDYSNVAMSAQRETLLMVSCIDKLED